MQIKIPTQLKLVHVLTNSTNRLYIHGIHSTIEIQIPDFLQINFKNGIFTVEQTKTFIGNKSFLIGFALKMNACIKQALLTISKHLFLRGVGFKFFKNKDNKYLGLTAGFSHLKGLKLPADVAIFIKNEKNTIIKLKGSNIPLLTQFAHDIQKLKYPDIYKGKGVHIYGKKIILKEGKKQK